MINIKSKISKRIFFKCYTIILFGFTFFSASAQSINNQEQSDSYSKIIPELQYLKSGFPFVQEQNNASYNYFKDEKSRKNLFVGKTVTTDDIKREIKSGIYFETYRTDKYYKEDIPQVFDSLIIIADTFVLNENLWLPEIAVIIKSRIIDMKGKAIDVTALPYRSTIKKTIAKEEDRHGNNGIDGKDIFIQSNSIINRGTIISRGTTGEWIYAPKVKINYPSIFAGHEELRFNFKRCGGRKETSSSAGLDFKETNRCVGIMVESVGNCITNYMYPNTGLSFSRDNDFNANIVDDLKFKRIKFTNLEGTEQSEPFYKPGKGGNGGNIIVKSEKPLNQLLYAPRGNTGLYVVRNTDNEGNEYVSLNSNNFTSHRLKVNAFFAYQYIVENGFFEISARLRDGYQYISIPTSDELNQFYTKYKYFADQPNTDGKEGKVESKTGIKFINDYLYYEWRLNNLRVEYSIYYKKNEVEQTKINLELKDLVDELNFVLKSPELNDKDKYLSLLTEASKYNTATARNLDEYGNEPGFRPALSITSTLSYIEKNLESDIRSFIITDEMASDEKAAGKYKNEIPNIIEGIITSNNQLYDQLGLLNKEKDEIELLGYDAQKKTDSINSDLHTLESKIKEEVKDELERNRLIKYGLKGVALVSTMIPYGQPILGQVAGSGLEAYSETFDKGARESVSAIIEKTDLSGIAKSAANFRLRKLGKTQEDPVETGFLLYDPEIAKINKKLSETEKFNSDKEKKLQKKQEIKTEISKRETEYVSYAQKTQNILAGYLQSNVKESEIDAKVAEIAKVDSRFYEISKKLNEQKKVKKELFEKISTVAKKSLIINSEILKNTNSASALTFDLNDDNKYNEGVSILMESIRNTTLERIRSIEYQLAKIYEYTQLKPYTLQFPSYDVFTSLYKREKENKLDISKMVEKLSLAYKSGIANMKSEIIKNISTSHKQDANNTEKKNYGRKVSLFKDETNLNTFPTMFINDINDDNVATIDLQKDLWNEIIKPDESEVRIINISLDDLKLERPLPTGASIDLSVEIISDGVLRKEENFYLFTKDKNIEGQVGNRWKWTITNNKGYNEITNKSEISQQYESLVQFITNNPNGQNLFSLPPAWTKVKVSISKNGSTNFDSIKVNSLNLSFNCDYVESSDAKNKKVFDLKFENAPLGAEILKSSGNSQSQSIISNQYTFEKSTNLITLKLIEPTYNNNPNETHKRFEKWEISGINIKNLDLTKKEISFLPVNNVRVKAIFINK